MSKPEQQRLRVRPSPSLLQTSPIVARVRDKTKVLDKSQSLLRTFSIVTAVGI